MIGAIADDVTGATDVAVAFRRAGLRTLIYFGVPSVATTPDADAVVVALKSRTIPAADAVQQSLAALSWLERAGADRFYFKYCSTFDSRPEGNIGPVADALSARLGASVVAVVPSSPEHGRTQFLGHLFVGTELLSESPMRNHPLTPMTDSYIPRVLQAQTDRAVELVAHGRVLGDSDTVARALADLRTAGSAYAVIDVVDDADLDAIGEAVVDEVLSTGGAGLAGAIGRATVRRVPRPEPVGVAETGNGAAVALAGSCSARTLEQIAFMSADHPAYRLDALATEDSAALAEEALRWFDTLPADSKPLIYSSLPPDQILSVQEKLGVEESASLLERAMGLIAAGLVERGVRRIVVAGGETSGAVVSALRLEGGEIGNEVAPGVPWITSIGPRPLTVLLKSGNFGEVDLLARAVRDDVS